MNHANAAGLAMPSAAPAQTQTGKSFVSVSVTFSRVERWPGTERSPEAAVETTGLGKEGGGSLGEGAEMGRRREERRREKEEVEVSEARKKEKRTEGDRKHGGRMIFPIELRASRSP